MIPWTLMPNHWTEKDGEYTVPTKFSELRKFEGGKVDTQMKHISDLILSYNTAEGIDFDASLGGGGEEEEEEGGAGEGEQESGGDDEEEEEEE